MTTTITESSLKTLLKNYEGGLCAAVREGNIDIVKLFVENGFNTPGNIDDDDPLTIASECRHYEIFYLLCRGKREIDLCEYYSDEIEFINAIIKGDIEEVKKFLSTIIEGDIEKVKNLNDCGIYGINVNNSNEYGKTPLMYAAEYGYLEIVKLLLEKGADVNIKHFKKTAFVYAAENGHLEIAKLLVNRMC